MPSRMARLIRATIVGTAVGMILFYSPAASAGHGSWTTHHYVVQDPSPCCFKGWSQLNASDRYDWGHTAFQLWSASSGDLIAGRSANCLGNEACGFLKTNEYNWSQGFSLKYVKSLACARDGDHELGGVAFHYSGCSPQGLLTHEHQSGNFQ